MNQQVTETGLQIYRKLLIEREKEFDNALQGNCKFSFFMRSAISAVQRKPELLECSYSSLIKSLMRIAQLGMVPDDALGQVYIIPFNNGNKGKSAEVVVGYKGWRELALRTDKYKDIYAIVVYKNDPFEISLGTHDFIKHYPCETEPGPRRGCYAVAIHKDDSRTFRFWWARQIEAHKEQYSQSWRTKSSIWQTNPEMAYKKTMIKQLASGLQLQTAAQKIIQRDEIIESGQELPASDSDEFIDIDGDVSMAGSESKNKTEPVSGVEGAETLLNKNNSKKNG